MSQCNLVTELLAAHAVSLTTTVHMTIVSGGLFLTRVLLTFGGFFVIYFLHSLALRLEKCEAGAKAKTPEWEKSRDKSLDKTCSRGLPMLFARVFAYKFVILLTRAQVLRGTFKLLRASSTAETEAIEHSLHAKEHLLYFDLLITGIPLGLVTILQLHLMREKATGLEIFKLIALCTDILLTSSERFCQSKQKHNPGVELTVAEA